jgi:redox-sensing transcriptional repressor
VGKVDLAVELQILAYHEQRRANAAQGSVVQSLSSLSIPGESRRGASA